MSNANLRTGLLILLGLVVIVLYSSVFFVQQTQNALVLRFGAVQAEIKDDPGFTSNCPWSIP